METSSHHNSKIGLKAIQDSIEKLSKLGEDVEKHLENLQNNIPQD